MINNGKVGPRHRIPVENQAVEIGIPGGTGSLLRIEPNAPEGDVKTCHRVERRRGLIRRSVVNENDLRRR